MGAAQVSASTRASSRSSARSAVQPQATTAGDELSQARTYEVVVIFDPESGPEVTEELIQRASAQAGSAGTEVLSVEHWGKRQLAYEIRHKSEGNYVLLTARGAPAGVQDMSRMLHLADEVLRHKVIRVPDGAPSAMPDAQAVELDLDGDE